MNIDEYKQRVVCKRYNVGNGPDSLLEIGAIYCFLITLSNISIWAHWLSALSLLGICKTCRIFQHTL